MTSTAAFDIVPFWDGTTAALDAYDERVKLYVMSTKKDEKCLCGPRLLARFAPESDSFRIVREALTDAQLTAEEGSGGPAIVKALRAQLGPKSMQQAVNSLLQLAKLNDIRRLGVDEEVDDAFLPLTPKGGSGVARCLQRNPSHGIPAPDDPRDSLGGNERTHTK